MKEQSRDLNQKVGNGRKDHNYSTVLNFLVQRNTTHEQGLTHVLVWAQLGLTKVVERSPGSDVNPTAHHRESPGNREEHNDRSRQRTNADRQRLLGLLDIAQPGEQDNGTIGDSTKNRKYNATDQTSHRGDQQQ